MELGIEQNDIVLYGDENELHLIEVQIISHIEILEYQLEIVHSHIIYG